MEKIRGGILGKVSRGQCVREMREARGGTVEKIR